MIRIADTVLVITCGNTLIWMLLAPFFEPTARTPAALSVTAIAVLALGFCIYAGWRHVGVIDRRVWSAQAIAFPLLLAVGLYLTIRQLQGQPGAQITPGAVLLGWTSYLLPCTLGFLGVWLLQHARIPALGATLPAILDALASKETLRPRQFAGAERVSIPRGLAFAVFGIAMLLSSILLPFVATVLPVWAQFALSSCGFIGFFILAHARRYFQFRADSLLAADARAPVLFLRSFDDDTVRNFGSTALLDFSLETRLANHFMSYGPFIAIGSPGQKVPQPGAARVLLSDSEWQDRVLCWIRDASMIVMYAGKTKWVNWELQRCVELGAEKLIIMIPEIQRLLFWKRQRDLAERLTQLRQTLENTRWAEPLKGLKQLRSARAILLRPSGNVVVIHSGPRNRDSYQMAAMLCHLMIDPRLDPVRMNETPA
jgi:hypothetical protein